MSKKNDDSIERIFRQALTQYDTEFHGEDWLKMERLLDEEVKRKAAARSRRIKGTAYTLTGLTGLIIAVYFLAIRNPSGSIASRSDSATEMQASEDLTGKGNVKHENSSESLLSESKDKAQPQKNESSEASTKNEVPIKSDALPDAQIAGRPLSQKDNRQNANSIALDENKARKRVTPSESKAPQEDKSGVDLTKQNVLPLTSPVPAENVEAISDKFVNGDDGAEDKIPSAASGESGKDAFQNDNETNVPQDNAANASAFETGSENQGVATEKDSSSVDHKLLLENLSDSEAVLDPADADKKNRPLARLSVAFVFAPEFSTTSLSKYSSPGESFGLRIGYQLSKRFSINTALIRSTKKYEDSGDIYKPRNPAYWQIRTNGVIPEQIDSRCLVYELPVGIQFDAIRTSKSRVFLSTAISSYFMLTQAYDYTFESPNPGADQGWRSQRSESYWFSVGMLSAGYEREISRSFAFGIEPYLKMSLAEIGWPNIKLFSTGAYLTLRYKFMSRRNF